MIIELGKVTDETKQANPPVATDHFPLTGSIP
jgi:hypothetical protein